MTSTASTPSNTYVLARNYTTELPLTLSQPIKARVGGSHYNITSGGKPLVLVLSGAEVKPAITKNGDATLIVSNTGAQTQVIIDALSSIRARLITQLGITDAQMKSLMVTSAPKAGLSRKKIAPQSTLFINPESTATLVNLEKVPVEYETIKNKNCSMAIYLRIQSVFKHDTGLYTCVFKAGHLVLISVNEDLVVEQIDMAPISDDMDALSDMTTADLL